MQIPEAVIAGLRLAIADHSARVRKLAYEDLTRLASLPDSKLPSLLDTETERRIASDFIDSSMRPEVVVAALTAYASLGFPDQANFARAIELAHHELPQIRIAALGTFAYVPNSSAREAIVAGLTVETHADVRLAAIEAAVELGKKRSLAFISVDMLVDLIEDPESEIRAAAADSLSTLIPKKNHSRVAAILFDHLRQQASTEICVSLLRALEQLSNQNETHDVAMLARACMGLGGVSRLDRGVWSQSLKTVAQFRTLETAKLLEFLQQTKRFDPAVVLNLLREPASSGELVALLSTQQEVRHEIRGFLASDYSEETRTEALEVICRAGLDCQGAIERLLEETKDESDPQAVVRARALAALADNIEPRIYMSKLIDFMAQKKTYDDDPLREALAKAFWRDPDVVRDHLKDFNKRLYSSSNPVLQARAVDALGADPETARFYSAYFWQLLSERDEPGGMLRAAIVRAVGRSGYAEPYLAEMAGFLQFTSADDPFGNTRIATIDVLGGSSAQRLYIPDLLALLLRDDLHKAVRERLLVALKSWAPPGGRREWPFEPRHLGVMLNFNYERKGSETGINRFYTLYFGAFPRQNRLLLEASGYIARGAESFQNENDRRETFHVFRRLILSDGLNVHFRNKMATHLAMLGQDVGWKCRDRELLNETASLLKEMGYPRESVLLSASADRFGAAHCAAETTKGTLIVALIGVILLVVLARLVRGF